MFYFLFFAHIRLICGQLIISHRWRVQYSQGQTNVRSLLHAKNFQFFPVYSALFALFACFVGQPAVYQPFFSFSIFFSNYHATFFFLYSTPLAQFSLFSISNYKSIIYVFKTTKVIFPFSILHDDNCCFNILLTIHTYVS